MANVKILFFAKARELIGKESDSFSTLSLPNKASGLNILEQILEKYPALKVISQNIVLAINQEVGPSFTYFCIMITFIIIFFYLIQFIEPDQQLDKSSITEIAIIPPLSGG